jgi:hypothetical protein
VKNPLRSEAEAFQFLLGVVVYFAAIVIAAAINKWAGLAVFIVLSAGVIIWWLRARRFEAPVRTHVRHRGGDNVRRFLVVANETVGGRTLRDCITTKAAGYEEQVLVVCPALNSPLKHWTSDEDDARIEAQRRLEASLMRLRESGIDARGEVGDADPVQAMEDALRLFGADEIIISTHPEGRSHWLERGVVTTARDRFDVPVTHVVVDLKAEKEEVR